MQVTSVLRADSIPREHVERLAALVKIGEWKIYPNGNNGGIVLKASEFDPSVEVFRNYCRQNQLPFWDNRVRHYSKSEMHAASFLNVDDTPADVDANENTVYTNKHCCPKCGAGLEQSGPLTFSVKKCYKKKLFCVDLRNSHEWVVSSEVKPLFDGLTGFRWGEVVDSKTRKVSPMFHQIVVENRLPRMATITNFQQTGPPWSNRCECNRAGWRLLDEQIYERASLTNAKDFNVTTERLSGGGPCGLRWLVVSQAVHSLILKTHLLSGACFVPIHLIEKDSGMQHKFDLPLDILPQS